MNFKKLRVAKDVGRTSMDNGHSHEWNLNTNETSVDNDHGHTYDLDKLKADGVVRTSVNHEHSHTVEL